MLLLKGGSRFCPECLVLDVEITLLLRLYTFTRRVVARFSSLILPSYLSYSLAHSPGSLVCNGDPQWPNPTTSSRNAPIEGGNIRD